MNSMQGKYLNWSVALGGRKQTVDLLGADGLNLSTVVVSPINLTDRPYHQLSGRSVIRSRQNP